MSSWGGRSPPILASPPPRSTIWGRGPPGRWGWRGQRGRGDGPTSTRSRPAMSILVDRSTRVVVQGITGREGTFHALRCKEYGTQVVGGVTPGKGGTSHEGFPVWNTVEEAVGAAGADWDLIVEAPTAAG